MTGKEIPTIDVSLASPSRDPGHDRVLKLPAELEKAVAASLETWRRDGNVRRMWTGDADLWTGADEAEWLAWLGIVEEQCKRHDQLEKLAESIRQQEFSHVVLLGMGGSSLGPEVLAETFGRQTGHPELLVLDSTDPAQIRTVESKIDPARTLFMVSSKSGTTLEPKILKAYFFECAKRAVGADKAGSRFIAITDPGSQLQTMAERDRFRHVALGNPSIGGRYSVLSDFGMVPAAAMGLDVRKLLAATQTMVLSCAANVPPADNPGVVLGTILGVLGKAGRDKVTIVASPGIADFGAWLEQLLAESTGKQGRGLIPVDAELLGAPEIYGQDRLFAYIRLTGEADPKQDEAVAEIERAGHPVVRIAVADRYHIGQEFFRWEIATAVAGAILGVNPFDQPDVEASKNKSRELTAAYEKSGKLSPETALLEEAGLTLFADEKNSKALGRGGTLVEYLAAHLERIREGDYCALLAYVERNKQHRDALNKNSHPDSRPQARRDLPRVRAEVPSFDGPGLQGRAEHRRVPSDHLRRRRRRGCSGSRIYLWCRQGGAGARRLRGIGRARPACPAHPSRRACRRRFDNSRGRRSTSA